MIIAYLQLAVSFCLLIFASYCVGEGGEILGDIFDASILGGVIIAWLNTAPEAIFFITALNDSQPAFAIGAVAGSTITVCTIALGSCIYIGTRVRSQRTIVLQPNIKQQALYLALSVLCPLYIICIGLDRVAFALGLMCYSYFLYFSITSSSPVVEHGKDVELGMLSDDDEDENSTHSTWKGWGYLLLGGLLIAFISGYFIEAVVNIADHWNLSSALFAFTLAPIASEAPEVMEAISLARKGKSQGINIAFSNLVGGTISKTTLLLGIFSLYGYIFDYIWMDSYTVTISLLAIAALSAGLIGFLPKKLHSYHGLMLFGLFFLASIIQYYDALHAPEPIA